MRPNYKEIKKKIALRFLPVLILFFSLSLIVVGQNEESNESVPVAVTDQAMEQVVRRILVWYFKPRKQKKVIYLAEKGLQKPWLPRIEGVEFWLLPENEVAKKTAFIFLLNLKKSQRINFILVLPSVIQLVIILETVGIFASRNNK